jgi:hypothetical protein
MQSLSTISHLKRLFAGEFVVNVVDDAANEQTAIRGRKI